MLTDKIKQRPNSLKWHTKYLVIRRLISFRRITLMLMLAAITVFHFLFDFRWYESLIIWVLSLLYESILEKYAYNITKPPSMISVLLLDTALLTLFVSFTGGVSSFFFSIYYILIFSASLIEYKRFKEAFWILPLWVSFCYMFMVYRMNQQEFIVLSTVLMRIISFFIIAALFEWLAGYRQKITIISRENARDRNQLQILTKQLEQTNKELTKMNDATRRELEIARQIQMGILPQDIDPIPGIQVKKRYKPTSEVGGDY